MTFTIGFLIGVIVGACVGVVLFSVATAAGRADE